MKLPHSTTILGVCQINLFPREEATSFQLRCFHLAKNSLYLECATALENISGRKMSSFNHNRYNFIRYDWCICCFNFH